MLYLFVILSILFIKINAHYIPIIEGNELIKVADRAETSIEREATCKFLLELFDERQYACFSRSHVFNYSDEMGTEKNVIYETINNVFKVNNILEKNREKYEKELYETSDLFRLLLKDPISLVLTETFEFYHDKITEYLTNYTYFDEKTNMGFINISTRTVYFSMFPDPTNVTNYCSYVDNKENMVCISTNKSVYIDMLNAYVNFLGNWIY